MAANRRVAAQHEDWLNLTDAEPPWFALPAIRRALPDGLDPTPPQVRAEHKARWHSDNGADPARLTQDRSSYINWLLRDVLGWTDHYLTGDQLPSAFADGVTRHDVTVKPTGVYQPDPPAPVGLLDQPAPDPASKSGGDPRSLVFVLAAGTDPQQRPPATPGQRHGCNAPLCHAATTRSRSRWSPTETTSPSCTHQSEARPAGAPGEHQNSRPSRCCWTRSCQYCVRGASSARRRRTPQRRC